jgi:hypothetical protein
VLQWIRDLGNDVVQGCSAHLTSEHLGDIKDEPHWVALVFDMMEPEGVIRFGNSFGSPILEELSAAGRWWLAQPTAAKIKLADLPIRHQEDGFSCGMLVGNVHERFVDPSIPLAQPSHHHSTCE